MAAFGMAMQIVHALNAQQPIKKFWREKLDKNIERDKATINALKQLGWEVLTVWTCEVKDTNKLKTKLLSFLERQEEKIAHEI